MFVKICGLTSTEAVAAAVAAGADALGFVFARSPRQISPNRALALCHGLPDSIVRVAVMHHPAAEEWTAVREVFSPDWLQTDAEDLGTLELGARCEPLPVFRNGSEEPAGGWPARLLFEGMLSGGGQLADWREAALVAGKTDIVLAGGLGCDNVAAAVQQVRPWGVDVSSGVERAPGIKDPDKIRRFVARAKAVET